VWYGRTEACTTAGRDGSHRVLQARPRLLFDRIVRALHIRAVQSAVRQPVSSGAVAGALAGPTAFWLEGGAGGMTGRGSARIPCRPPGEGDDGVGGVSWLRRAMVRAMGMLGLEAEAAAEEHGESGGGNMSGIRRGR
jgi:hypothetical protein